MNGSGPWHLPGVSGWTGPWHEGRSAAGAEVRTPRLDPSTADAVADRVREAALRARGELELEAVVAATSRAARAIADFEGPVGREAASLLGRELGWSERLSRETLEEMARGWTRSALWAVLRSELPDPGVLDGFRPHPLPEGTGTRLRRAAAPPLTLHVHAGNVPGVAVTSAVRGLLVRGGVLCKTAEEEPGLLPLFARALAREEPLLGDTLAVTWWPGTSQAAEWEAWTAGAGRVVLYGGGEAVASVRRRLGPGTDLVVYGPRTGVGVVLPDAAAGAAARRSAEALARDVCAYDQRGCVSPRTVLVLGDPAPFAQAVADALDREVRRLPLPPPTPAEAVALRELRAEAEFRGYGKASAAGRGGSGGGAAPAAGPGTPPRLFADEGLAWTVIVGEGPEPAAPLPRVLRLRAVSDLSGLESLLRPLEDRIQALGYAGERGAAELAELAVRLGIPRVAPFGSVAWPPVDWRQDGRLQLLPLLRWTDWEGP